MHDLHLDDALTDEQRALVQTPSQRELNAIDARLLSGCSQRWQKIAFVVATAMSALTNTAGIPDVFFLHRIRKLVNERALESRGDLANMRYCEIRVPLSYLSSRWI